MARRISSSRPITGSNLPSRARCVRSVPYLARASNCCSLVLVVTVFPLRGSVTARFRSISVGSPLPRYSPRRASRRASAATNESPSCPARVSAF